MRLRGHFSYGWNRFAERRTAGRNTWVAFPLLARSVGENITVAFVRISTPVALLLGPLNLLLRTFRPRWQAAERWKPSFDSPSGTAFRHESLDAPNRTFLYWSRFRQGFLNSPSIDAHTGEGAQKMVDLLSVACYEVVPNLHLGVDSNRGISNGRSA